VAEQNKTTTPRRARPKSYNDKHIIGFIFIICLSANLLIGAMLSARYALNIPDINNVVNYRPLQTTYILDRKGKVIERIFVENRTVVPFKKMPELLGKAFVAAEDGKFFEHPGLDFVSVLRALINNVRAGRRGQGGSTITQQVAKSLLLSPEKTYLRKFKEAILAWRIDTLLSKQDILYIYLNQIYLGAGAHGVEAASQVYFNKHVWQMNLAEMAVLAGLPQAPSRYSPIQHPERAQARQKYVLNRMAADGFITADQARDAFLTELTFGSEEEDALTSRDTGYYTQIVKDIAADALAVPLTQAGVTIQTYMDSDKQKEAIEALKIGTGLVGVRNNSAAPQGALVSMNACNGEVLALAGGTDFIESQYNRAYSAKRPAGSVFKPLVYATAIDKGWNVNSTISDSPLEIKGAKGKIWRPKNFSSDYHGQVSLLEALTNSYNIPAIRLLQNVGIKPVHSLAKNDGITSKLTPDLSLALGAVDVSPLEMTAAYSPFVCGGTWAKPRFIASISDPTGKYVYGQQKESHRVVSSEVAATMKFMLEKVITDGTGHGASGLPGLSGGKTGTTNENRDAWFIGFQNKLLTGVWIGHDKNMSLGSHENGGKTSAPVWFNYMKKIQ